MLVCCTKLLSMYKFSCVLLWKLTSVWVLRPKAFMLLWEFAPCPCMFHALMPHIRKQVSQKTEVLLRGLAFADPFKLDNMHEAKTKASQCAKLLECCFKTGCYSERYNTHYFMAFDGVSFIWKWSLQVFCKQWWLILSLCPIVPYYELGTLFRGTCGKIECRWTAWTKETQKCMNRKEVSKQSICSP